MSRSFLITSVSCRTGRPPAHAAGPAWSSMSQCVPGPQVLGDLLAENSLLPGEHVTGQFLGEGIGERELLPATGAGNQLVRDSRARLSAGGVVCDADMVSPCVMGYPARAGRSGSDE